MEHLADQPVWQLIQEMQEVNFGRHNVYIVYMQQCTAVQQCTSLL